MDEKQHPKQYAKNKQKTNYIGISEAYEVSGMHPHTLRKHFKDGKIKGYKTPSGQIKFDKSCLVGMCSMVESNDIEPTTTGKINFIYTRVSSKKQSNDLERQIEFIRKYRPEYDLYVCISDIASGINFKRKGIETLLDACIQRTIGEVVVAHRDRLCRFGYELLRLFIEKSGGRITVIDDEQHKYSDQELSEDLLSIIHIYSCKQMGKRSYKNKNNNEMLESKIKTNDKATENTEELV